VAAPEENVCLDLLSNILIETKHTLVCQAFDTHAAGPGLQKCVTKLGLWFARCLHQEILLEINFDAANPSVSVRPDGVERFFVTLTAVGFAALVVCPIWIFLIWLDWLDWLYTLATG
jgi:hypothetical protein